MWLGLSRRLARDRFALHFGGDFVAGGAGSSSASSSNCRLLRVSLCGPSMRMRCCRRFSSSAWVFRCAHFNSLSTIRSWGSETLIGKFYSKRHSLVSAERRPRPPKAVHANVLRMMKPRAFRRSRRQGSFVDVGCAFSKMRLSCQIAFVPIAGGDSRRRSWLCQNCVKTPSLWGVGSCWLSERSLPKILISGTSVWSEWRV
jgi:hypothetical protein